MNNLLPLEPNRYYHIYNRANGSENLFREEANYTRFLQLYDKYISPVANTFAWVLMPNHFHFFNNPVHHGFVDHPAEYPWSSYHACLSAQPTKLHHEIVVNWFDGIHNFRAVHHNPFDHPAFDKWLDVGEEV